MTTRAVDLLRRAVADADDRPDADLLADFVRSRDPAAVEAIVRRHGPMVWGVCRRALPHHDAEDAFQATFLVLARRPDAVRPPGLLGNWLYGVARRTALKARALAAKRQMREATVDTLPEPPAPEPAEWADLRPVLDRELERLPAKYRAPIVLCDLEGKTRQEAARRLGWPEGTVNSRLSLARKKLAARLARRGLALSGGVLTVTLVERAAARVPADLLTATVRLLTDPAAAPGPATILAHQVVRAMTLTRLQLTALVLVAAGLVGGGAFLIPGTEGAPRDRPGSVAADKDALVLKGHTDSVFGIAFSPNGRTVTTASFDKTVKVWDATTGKELFTLKGHTLPVLSVVYEPDGKHLVTAASKFRGEFDRTPGEVKRWNAETGEEVQSFAGNTLPTFAAAVSPDATRVVAVGGTSDRGELRVWDTRTGKVLYQAAADVVWPFMAADYSPDGKLLAVGGGKEVRVYETATGKLVFQSAGHPDPVYAAAFSPDGERVASAGAGKPSGIRLWESHTGKKLPMIETTQRTIRHLAYSRDGTRIAAAAFDGTARLYDVATGAELLSLKHNGNVNAVALSPDGKRLAVACADKTARVYTLQELAAAPAKAESKEKGEARELDARETAEAFFRAAVAGEVDEARSHVDPQKVSAKKVGEIRQIGLKRVDISTVLAGETEALVVSEPVTVPKEGKGHLLLDVRKKDGRWRVRDIDFRSAEEALARQRDFLDGHADAKPVRARK